MKPLTDARFNYERRTANGEFAAQLLRVCLLIFLLGLNVSAQIKLAVFTPEKTSDSLSAAEKLETALSAKHKIIDSSLADTVFRSAAFEKPFNLSLDEAKNLGQAVGTDFFLLVKSETLRRASFAKPEYYESYAVIFAASARTGKLVYWKLASYEADKPNTAEKILFAAIDGLAAEISAQIAIAREKEMSESAPPKIEEMPAAETENFRSPLPYKRLKPPYTAVANLYSVTATVDATIDFDENGKITRAEISRWAGYNLDESVLETIRKMNWRAAERNGKTLPMRVLLRYNFRKKTDD